MMLKICPTGFIFVSMGSSVRASGMPEALRHVFVAAFATLPCNVVWKWEGGKIKDLPSNVRTAAWWPQQDLLGHPKLRAFVSHGGLLSLHEAAYHGAPTLVLPVFCDHDGNAAQAGERSSCVFKEINFERREKRIFVYREVGLRSGDGPGGTVHREPARRHSEGGRRS